MLGSPSNFDRGMSSFRLTMSVLNQNVITLLTKKSGSNQIVSVFRPKKSSFNQTVIMVPPKIIRNLPNYLSLLSEEIWQEHKIMEN